MANSFFFFFPFFLWTTDSTKLPASAGRMRVIISLYNASGLVLPIVVF